MSPRERTAREWLDQLMTEDELLEAVTAQAVQLGWDWVHFRPALTSKGWRTPVSGTIGKGWPDLVLVRRRDRRLIVAELKAQDGRVDSQQAAILELLRQTATPDVFVWRPSDWSRGVITTVLE